MDIADEKICSKGSEGKLGLVHPAPDHRPLATPSKQTGPAVSTEIVGRIRSIQVLNWNFL